MSDTCIANSVKERPPVTCGHSSKQLQVPTEGRRTDVAEVTDVLHEVLSDMPESFHAHRNKSANKVMMPLIKREGNPCRTWQ
jgi:hypothetical protein